MEIEIGKYIIRSTSNGDYDLVEKVTRNKSVKNTNGKLIPTGEVYEGYSDISYNMSLEYCINKIIKLNIHDMDIKCSLNEFLDVYRHEVDKVVSLYNLYEKVS